MDDDTQRSRMNTTKLMVSHDKHEVAGRLHSYRYAAIPLLSPLTRVLFFVDQVNNPTVMPLLGQ